MHVGMEHLLNQKQYEIELQTVQETEITLVDSITIDLVDILILLHIIEILLLWDVGDGMLAYHNQCH